MAKRQLSEKQKAALAKGRAKLAEKKRQNDVQPNQVTESQVPEDATVAQAPPPPQPNPTPQPQPQAFAGMTQEKKDELLLYAVQRLEQLEAERAAQPKVDPWEVVAQIAAMREGKPAPGQPTVGDHGVEGIKQIYPIEETAYPNPVERLYNLAQEEPRMTRHNLRENFIFTWKVVGQTYERANVWYREPLFQLQLWRRIFDDQGNDTNTMFMISQQFMSEDPVAAERLMHELGIPADDFQTKEEMMNEMRFQRLKRWVLDLFYPPRPQVRQEKETVIDGRVVIVKDNEEFTDPKRAAQVASEVA